MLGSWLFRSSSFRNSFFSQVAMHSWFMVCLSTSSLSRDLFLAGQASTAKWHFAGPRCVHGLEKTIVWLDTACCTFVGGGWEPGKEKGDSVCGLIGARSRRVGNPTKNRRKSLRLSEASAPCTGILRHMQWAFVHTVAACQSISECGAGKRGR